MKAMILAAGMPGHGDASAVSAGADTASSRPAQGGRR
jgi:hypothetical protein